MHPADAAMRLAVSLVDTRFNPHHDKLGKFAPKSGGGTGTVTADGWTYKSGAELSREHVDQFERDFERETGRKLTVDERAKVEDVIGPTNLKAELSKGDITITDVSSQGIARKDLDDLAKQAEMLQQTNPAVAGKVWITVNAAASFRKVDGGYVAGESVPQNGRVRLNERIFGPQTFKDVTSMPAEMQVGPKASTLVHEWGHLTDDGKNNVLWASHLFDLSNYGQTAPHEGRAEAFAEFYLTRGTTTNPAAQAYAKANNWKTW